MTGPSEQYLRHLSDRWRRTEDGAARELADALFRELLAGLGPFTQREMDVLCRGATIAALASCMAGLVREFTQPEEALAFIQLVACRAAVEAENARDA
ncbi:MAG: hypothetical protein ACRDH6_09925 [Actinomycetota bacterium]